MAHVYSAKAPHLSSVKSIRYSPGPVSLTVLALVSTCFSWLFAGMVSVNFSPLVKLILFFTVCIVVFNILKEFYIVYRRSNNHRFLFSTERYQENLVLAQLATLPENFSVFHRVDVPGVGKVHVVVTGPPGVFAIRIRHMYGVIGYNGHELVHNGSELGEIDLLQLTHKKADTLSNFLRSKTGEEIVVKPVIVFSPDTIVTQLTFAEIHGVEILSFEFLDDYLIRGILSGSALNTAKINEILLSMVMK